MTRLAGVERGNMVTWLAWRRRTAVMATETVIADTGVIHAGARKTVGVVTYITLRSGHQVVARLCRCATGTPGMTCQT